MNAATDLATKRAEARRLSDLQRQRRAERLQQTIAKTVGGNKTGG